MVLPNVFDRAIYTIGINKIEIKSSIQLISIMDLTVLPQDIINHIGVFYITTNMKYLCRIDKMKKKWEKGGGKTTQSPELTFENADSLEASQYNGFE